jgi:TonB family protein
LKSKELLVPGILSVLLHALFFQGLFLSFRSRVAVISAIELDLALWPVSASATSSLASKDEWYQPVVIKNSRIVPTAEPTPTIKPSSLLVTTAAQGLNGLSAGFSSSVQVSRPPRPINPIKPLYPEAAKRANIEGVVILQVDIDATGVVKKVGVIQALGYGCDEQAISAVNQTSWDPALDQNNQPVATKVKIPFRFKFE